MFGKILSVYDYTVVVENLLKRVETSFLGVHVVFEDKHKVVGEISKITCDEIECVLVGEFINDIFESGITHKPSGNSKIRIVNKDEVIILLGNQSIDSKTDLYIGKSLIYEGFNVSANINNLFSNHFAILGNSGSGKSCTVTRLFQNLFYRNTNVPVNARIVLFDVYGEYHTAFEPINQSNNCRYKVITTDINADNTEILRIPAYFLEVDEIALLLGADSPAQLSIIDKALRYVYLFTEDEDKVLAHKNNIIAQAVMDILTSGKEPARIRDQIIAVLTTFKTKNISLDSEIVQPGYTRTLRQCLNLDQTGKINAIQLVTEYIEGFIDESLKLSSSMKPKRYTLSDLYSAFEFALISEGVLKSDKVFDINNTLKVRLESILNGDNLKYFEVNDYITREDYVKKLFTNYDGSRVQLVNFNLNYVDERFAKVLTKVISKLLLDYAISVDKKENFSVQILLEEAHRYVVNDNDTNIIGYNIFDRITKEGRKYGVILGMITQRPSELSSTALSQCSNYIVLRMFHPSDLDIIKEITHSISENDLEKIKSLGPGSALCFGTAFNMPEFTKIDPPNPYPNSSNAQIEGEWFN
ncbi:MAG: DUF87 domain-containing protein [Bacilli bacterium]|nr:DUF87 domain-containing protein [Bacilli bacterium]